MTAPNPLKRWDAADHLENSEDMVLYLNACIDDDPGDGSLIRAALNDIATEAGLTRAGLYKALSPEGKPGFDTMLRITRALGMNLHFDQ